MSHTSPTAPIGMTAASSVSATSSPGLPIPDLGTVSDTITIDLPVDYTVRSAVVGLNIDHPFIGDLSVSLVSPDQQRAVVLDRVGGGVDDIHQTFTVDGLEGAAINGNWTLLVSDGEGMDVGTLDSWSLDLTYGAASTSSSTSPLYPVSSSPWEPSTSSCDYGA